MKLVCTHCRKRCGCHDYQSPHRATICNVKSECVYTRTKSHPPLLCTGCDDEPSFFHNPCSLSTGVCSDFPIRQSFADVENRQDENSHREDDTCPDCGERGKTESEFLCYSEVLVIVKVIGIVRMRMMVRVRVRMRMMVRVRVRMRMMVRVRVRTRMMVRMRVRMRMMVRVRVRTRMMVRMRVRMRMMVRVRVRMKVKAVVTV